MDPGNTIASHLYCILPLLPPREPLDKQTAFPTAQQSESPAPDPQGTWSHLHLLNAVTRA